MIWPLMGKLCQLFGRKLALLLLATNKELKFNKNYAKARCRPTYVCNYLVHNEVLGVFSH